MNYKRFNIYLFLVILVIGIMFISTPLQADSYWKVVRWNAPNITPSYIETIPILASQDCNVIEPGYGWFQVRFSPTPIYLMIRTSDPKVNSIIESFQYRGLDSNGIPLIVHFVSLLPSPSPEPLGTKLILNFFPPCIEPSSAAFTLNGNSSTWVTVDNMEPIIFSARYSPSIDNLYYLICHLSDTWWTVFGVPIKQWMALGQSPYYFNHTSFDLRKFCELNNFQLIQGNTYALGYALAPWEAKNKLFYVTDYLKDLTDQVPVMTANITPMGIASASSVYANDSSYQPWKAFDGNDVSEPWSMWISAYRQFPAWLTYDFRTQKYITAYYILPQYSTANKDRSPRDWQLQGWNGSSWLTIDTRTNIRNDIEWNAKGLSFKVKAPGYYSQYRLVVTAVNGSDVTAIRQFKLLF